MSKTLTLSGYNRPDYFATTLKALAKCDGISEYDVVVVLDPSDKTPEIAEFCKGQGVQTMVMLQRIGCGAMIHYCMALGFRVSDYHIHLEDDTVPSPDFLRWMEWGRTHAPKQTLTISAYNQHGDEADPSVAGFRHWFTPWGWATWKSAWEKYLLPNWDNSFWDGGVQRVRENMGNGEIFPRVSRIQNIGATRGAFCPSPEFHQENHHATRVATELDKNTKWILT